MKIGLNFEVVDKNVSDFKFLSAGRYWKITEVTLGELCRHIGAGYSFMPVTIDRHCDRKKEHCNFAEVLAIDIDRGMNIEEAIAHDFLKRYCMAGYTSPSHTEQQHKFRLVFRLAKPVLGSEAIERCMAYLLYLIPEGDGACKDASRFYFGSTTADFFILNDDAILPENFAELADSYIEAQEREKVEQAAAVKARYQERLQRGDYDGQDELAEAMHALSFIPPRVPGTGTYPLCRDVLWSLCDNFGADEAIRIMSDHSPTTKRSDWDVERIARQFKPGAGITKATLFGMAKKFGYRPLLKKTIKREKVAAVRQKLESDYAVDPEITMENAIMQVENAIAAKEALDEEYLLLKEQAIADPLDSTLKTKAATKKEEIRLLADKIRNLKSNRSELRMQLNRIRKEALSQQSQEEKDTPFRKDRRKILELFQGKLRYNTLKHTIEYNGETRLFEETRAELSKLVGFDNWYSSDESVFKLLLNLAKEDSYCPFQEYLESIEDPEIEHDFLDTLASTIYGTKDPLQNQYLKRTLIGAVRRTYEPGCPHPYVLILYSKSRWAKSHSIAALFGDEYTGAGLISMEDKDSIMTLSQSIVHELPEMDKIFNQKDSSTMKSFITITTDTYRPPYGRSVVQNKRRTILVGTTNHNNFLTDETGNKRYLIIELGHEANTDFIYAFKDSIWAAALDGYRKGISNELPNDAMESSEERNKDFLFQDVWEEPIAQYIKPLAMVTTKELLIDALRIDLSRITKIEQNRVGKIMRNLGWIYKAVKISGENHRRWCKESNSSLPE